jgi:hypothetical protein
MKPIQSPFLGLASWNVTVIACPVVKQDLVAAIELLAMMASTVGGRSNTKENHNDAKWFLICFL